MTSCLVGDPALGDLAGTADAEPSLIDVPYGSELGCEEEVSDELCGGSQLIDIYPAEAGASRGTIVWIHGGGLFHGDKSRLDSAGPIFEQLQRGWSVVSVNYRLIRPKGWQPPTTSTSTTSASTTSTTAAPEGGPGSSTNTTPTTTMAPAAWVPDSEPPPQEGYDNQYPAALQDVVAAIDWVRNNGASHGLATNRVVVAGHSAGGMLAAMIGLGWNSELATSFGITRPDAWVTMAAPMDLATFDTAEMMDAWVGPSAAQMVAPLSPIQNIDALDPPGYLAHGDRDNVVHSYHATATEFVYGLLGLATDVRVDVVDRDSSGGALGPGPRWHLPGDGVGMEAFNQFMDDI